MENNQSFEYTYSAAQQQEIESIRSKYLPREEDKMERLRKLHHSTTQKAQAWAITPCVIGTGMSLCLTDLAANLGNMSMVLGILTGVAGLGMVALAYPLYNTVLKKERQRIAPEILRLTDELLK